MIHTILQILVFQLLFLAVYDLFLKKETFFSLNRIYLLLTPVLSVVLPFVSIGFIQQNIPEEYFVQLPSVLLGEVVWETGSNSSFWLPTLINLWIIGIIGSTLIFSYKIYKLVKLKLFGISENIDGTPMTILSGTDTAFSFFNTIYLGKDISEENKTSIIAHEKVHIRQKHSLDLLYFELLRIVFWFNPLVYLFQNRIAILHEYIADSEIARHKGKTHYYQNLLSEVFQTEKISFVNTFFNQSLIKDRILMLQKSKSKKMIQLKYLLLLPLIGLMLVYASCSDEIGKKESEVVQIDTVEAGKEIADVPFSVIERVPTYPGCSGDNETMKKCMSTKIAEFLNENFNTGLANELNISGMQRIATQFKIDKTGRVVDVRASSLSHTPELEEEAIRVVKLLPQMTPGEQKGEKVGVLYSLPIVFEIK